MLAVNGQKFMAWPAYQQEKQGRAGLFYRLYEARLLMQLFRYQSKNLAQIFMQLGKRGQLAETMKQNYPTV